MAEGGRPLQFSPFASHVHPGFWNAFSKKKLEEMQLSEEPVPLNGQFVNRDYNDLDIDLNFFVERLREYRLLLKREIHATSKRNKGQDLSKTNSGAAGLSSALNVEWDAFQGDSPLSWDSYLSSGTLINKNTLDAFKQCDKVGSYFNLQHKLEFLTYILSPLCMCQNMGISGFFQPSR